MASPQTPQPPQPPTNSETPVRVSRTFEANRQRVFRAWTDPELLIRWFADDDSDMTVRALDLRVGGRYRFEGTKSGHKWTIEGVFREVKPPERLVYTWGFPENPEFGEPGETTVTVDFRERGKATEVTVTHEGFTNAVARSEHNKGWIGCLDRLGTVVASS
ncbi:MAG TPA: SRPBCC domain-containing protein [Thermoanaerobaculia bacterium]|jgi:uncharacterized protein YndB with AHSA1/START domain